MPVECPPPERSIADGDRSVVAPGFGTWIGRWAEELEAGVFVLDRAPGAALLPRDEREGTRLWAD